MCDAAEALWIDEIRQRSLVERQVYAARMAQAEEFDLENLPDLDKAVELFSSWLRSDESTEELSPEDERRVVLGLGKKER